MFAAFCELLLLPATRVHPLPASQGDACAFPSGLGTFDALLAANLLCRVPNPAAFFDQADAHLAPGGLLVLTSPFTWMEEYTDKAGWVGATYDAAGQPRRCADALKQVCRLTPFCCE